MKTRNMISLLLVLISLLPKISIAQEQGDSTVMEKTNIQSVGLDSLRVFKKERHTTYSVEAFGSLSSEEHTPFWMTNHKWGVIPLKADNYYLQSGIFHNQLLNKNMSYGFGLDLVASSKQSNKDQFWIQQAYGDVQWKIFKLTVGIKEDYGSIVDADLSTGDMVHSNNARPSPEIKISIPEFTSFPVKNKIFYIKGDFAVGKFLDGKYLENTATPFNQNYTKDALLHRKSFYFRIGNIALKEKGFQVIAGIEHHVQWGGDLYFTAKNESYELPNSFNDLLHVVLATSGVQESKNDAADPKLRQATGSHIASYNFKVDYGTEYSDQVYSIYWQHIAEDMSGVKMQNYPDMLLGIQYKSKQEKLFSNVVFEYLYTKNQSVSKTSGTTDTNSTPPETTAEREKTWPDDYYNNSTYPQGMSYFGRSLGNVLFLSPEYNDDGYLGFRRNRIMALHLGIDGYLSDQIQYTLLGTYGESINPHKSATLGKRTGFASGLDITYHFEKIKGFTVKCSVGYDCGEFFGSKTFGGGISIKKTGKLF